MLRKGEEEEATPRSHNEPQGREEIIIIMIVKTNSALNLNLKIFELERRSVVEKKQKTTTSPTEQVNRRGNATKRRNFFFFHSDSFCFPPHFVVVFVRLTITTPSRPKVFFGSRWRWRETATGFLTRVQTLLLSFFFVLATITTRSFWYFHLQIDYTTYRRVARRACSAFRESATSAHPDDRCSSWYRRPATWVAPPIPPGPVPARLPGTKMSISAF